MSEERPNIPYELMVRFTDVQTKKTYHIHQETILRSEFLEMQKKDAESVAVHSLHSQGYTLIKTQWLPNIEHGGSDLHVTFGKMDNCSQVSLQL